MYNSIKKIPSSPNGGSGIISNVTVSLLGGFVSLRGIAKRTERGFEFPDESMILSRILYTCLAFAMNINDLLIIRHCWPGKQKPAECTAGPYCCCCCWWTVAVAVEAADHKTFFFAVTPRVCDIEKEKERQREKEKERERERENRKGKKKRERERERERERKKEREREKCHAAW